MTGRGRATRLADAFARAAGWSDTLARDIHPDDDMLRFAADLGVEAERGPALYLRGGREAARAFEHVCAATGAPLGSRARVLEFACGYGRVTRFLAPAAAPGALVSSDVLPGAVDFVERRFGVTAHPSATDPAALDLGGPFDAILVASLFSHLPEPSFAAFLKRLLAELVPGGVLVLSTHGLELAPPNAVSDGDFAFLAASESRLLPGATYGSTFLSPRRFRRLAEAAGARAIAGFERALWDLQDLWVLGDASLAPRLASLAPPPFANGSLELAVLRAGRGTAGGWVRTPEAVGPATRVALCAGDELVGPFDATLGPATRLAFARGELPGRWHREWWLEGPLPQLPGEEVPLVALAAVQDGALHPFDARLVAVER